MARVALSSDAVVSSLTARLEELKNQKKLMDAEIVNVEGTLKALGDSKFSIAAIDLPGVAGRYAPTGIVTNGKKRGRPVGSGGVKRAAKKRK